MVQAQLSTIAKLLEVQSQSRLPLTEPGILSDDPLHYWIWIKAFETLVEYGMPSVPKNVILYF